MTTILETIPGRGCSLGVPLGIHPVTDVRDLTGSWVSDITVERAAAQDECRRDAYDLLKPTQARRKTAAEIRAGYAEREGSK